ncbi:hypothetical protein RGQ29_005082 [Quercus rubra]|uniref:HVA22-like protein n=1 Tax=Quercus rubra TaxID=3512 RepID=A0AAN7E3N2_QUERU|nr:hypothetical protein RGQ29_005082 [Quercus rubra]
MMCSFFQEHFCLFLAMLIRLMSVLKLWRRINQRWSNFFFLCQYWIIVAMLTVFERVGDTFISWLPLYSEAKLAIFIYLWHPKTKGTSYVYNSFFRPYVAKHEVEFDHTLLELRVKAGDIAILYWQKAVSFGQTRFFEILQYVSS